jgi:hypothetical protein
MTKPHQYPYSSLPFSTCCLVAYRTCCFPPPTFVLGFPFVCALGSSIFTSSLPVTITFAWDSASPVSLGAVGPGTLLSFLAQGPVHFQERLAHRHCLRRMCLKAAIRGQLFAESSAVPTLQPYTNSFMTHPAAWIEFDQLGEIPSGVVKFIGNTFWSLQHSSWR